MENAFLKMSNDELVEILHNYEQWESIGAIPDDSVLAKVRDQYCTRNSAMGILMLEKDLLRAVAKRWLKEHEQGENIMQDLNKLANVILEAATREKGRHNLIVMLGTDALAVDGSMFLNNKDIAVISAKERNVLDETLAEKNRARLDGLSEAIAMELGSCSDSMKCLLAYVLELSKSHKIIMVEQTSYRLNMSEMVYVVDFLKREFPDTVFIHTTGNDLVRRNSSTHDVIYVFDDEWVFYDCDEFDKDSFVSVVVPQTASGVDILLNHCMNDLWTDDDELAFKAIAPKELSNTEKMVYETIKKERGLE